jgi:hypothetical protein
MSLDLHLEPALHATISRQLAHVGRRKLVDLCMQSCFLSKTHLRNEGEKSTHLSSNTVLLHERFLRIMQLQRVIR